MKLQINKISGAVAVLLATSITTAAYAANTAELKVIGKVTPASCDITLGGGGVATLDFGKITGTQQPPEQKTNLAIQCNANTLVAFTIKDNRASSRVDNLTMGFNGNLANLSDASYFGLGVNGTDKIGAWAAYQSNPKVDGKTVAMVLQAADSNYAVLKDGSRIAPGETFSWATTAPGARELVAGKLFTSDISAKVALQDTMFQSGKDISLDGSATLEVRYL